MTDLATTALLDDVARLAREAGRAILEIYDDPAAFGTELKGDGSPLTRADVASHRLLVDGLRRLALDVPVLSEESPEVPFAEREGWSRYWLVDPLDGTKEFVKRNGEFTVNVALVEVDHGVGRPVLGVVHVPVTGVSYLGLDGEGAWREDGEERRPIAPTKPDGTVRVVASRSHGSPETDAFIIGLEALHGTVERTSSGSSLKLCRVAEGAAHFYPRVAPTMEWDTAAAHAVVEAAGAVVWRYGAREPLLYNKRELLNPPFLVAYGPRAHLPDVYGEPPLDRPADPAPRPATRPDEETP